VIRYSKKLKQRWNRNESGKRLLFCPIRLDNAIMEEKAVWIAHSNIGDFSPWKEHDSYQKAFERLLRDLKVEEE
jgi:hypothetical protein